jgi:hypothetical protein
MILHTSQFTRMHYKPCEFGSDRSIIKGTLFGEPSNFSAVPLLALEGFS